MTTSIEPRLSLDHYSIRTSELSACRRFYGELLGLREGFRPPFNFPGIWYYAGEVSVVHIVGVDPDNPGATADYLGARAAIESGSGVIDHVAFAARGLRATRERLRQEGVSFRERTVPNLGLIQLFVEDPNGITLELNFQAAEMAA